ncbi:MAG TPA: hypothetical protein PK876_10280 [Elusimicrobiota bacterium]|nr:hypothetical protein [Elusimicrobiota bacterium]
MKKFVFLLAVTGFLLMRPYQIQNSGLLYTDDDEDYFAHATAIVFGNFPDYSKEYFNRGENASKKVPMGSIGCSILASPFVMLFSLTDRILHSPIIGERTRESIVKSWASFGFIVGTHFYFWLAAALLFIVLRRLFDSHCAGIALLLMLIAQGMPLYLYRRPVFSHIYEFFLQACVISACAYRDRLKTSAMTVILIGILSGLITLTRLNNIHFALLAPLLFFGLNRSISFRTRLAKIVMSLSVAALLISLFKLWPLLHNATPEPYTGTSTILLKTMNLRSLMLRILHILGGTDWGLLYTLPFFLIGTLTLLAFTSQGRDIPLRTECLILTLALTLNFFVLIQWGTQGGWYGYRFLMFSAIPISIIPLAGLLHHVDTMGNSKRRALYVLLAALAIQPVFSMLAFDGNNTNLTLHPVDGWGWGNPTYQIEPWKTLLHNPVQLAIALLKGGPLYAVYALAHLSGSEHRLPQIVLEKYPQFDWTTLIKSSLLYLYPLILLVWFSTLKRLPYRLATRLLRTHRSGAGVIPS